MKLTPCGWAFLRAEPQVGVRKKQTIKHTPNMLRIAIQAKGRLNEQSIDLLSEAGIRVAESKRKLISRAEGFPLEVLYLRDDDIPQAVSMGVADLGIVGLNEVAEKGFPVEQIMDLGFGGCRLSLAVAQNDRLRRPRVLPRPARRHLLPQHPRPLLRREGDRGRDPHHRRLRGDRPGGRHGRRHLRHRLLGRHAHLQRAGRGREGPLFRGGADRLPGA